MKREGLAKGWILKEVKLAQGVLATWLSPQVQCIALNISCCFEIDVFLVLTSHYEV